MQIGQRKIELTEGIRELDRGICELWFLHDSREDWCNGEGPKVGILGWKRLGYGYDASLLPLLRNG